MRNKQSSCHPSFSLENVKGSSNYKINKNTSSLKPACQFGAMTFICLFPFSTFAECTPTPDCASIGYTQTSCEGNYLACPFDSTKLKCLPCDSSFRYDCTGDNITAGIGNTCDGKYVSCECNYGASFINGACICDTSCKTIGNIVYSDKTCSSCVNANKTAVAVVVHSSSSTSLIATIDTPMISWSATTEDIAILNNKGREDTEGIDNTLKIVEHFGDDADTSTIAAVYCYNLEVTGFENQKKQWYLPAAKELNSYIFGNWSIINNTLNVLGSRKSSCVFLSSTEWGATGAWLMDNSATSVVNKTSARQVFCFLSIP